MKKLNFRRTKPGAADASNRITNETVAEHREQILAGGRKFKYPVQYAKHRLVINAVIVAVVATAALVAFTGFQLYVAQSSGTFFYRLTRIVQVPVASVDGEMVSFSNYLRSYRGSEYYLVTIEGVRPTTDNGKNQLDYVKRTSLTNAEMDAYAIKLARKNKITVSNKEVDAAYAAMKESPNGTVSDDVLNYSAQSIFNWSMSEAKEVIRNQLLMHKVKYFVDSNAKSKADKAAQSITTAGSNVKTIAEQLSDTTSKVESGASGMTPFANATGMLAEATKLEKGQFSGALKSPDGDGYYVLRIIDKTDVALNYEFVHIPLSEFVQQFEQIKRDGKIREFISVKEIQAPESQKTK